MIRGKQLSLIITIMCVVQNNAALFFLSDNLANIQDLERIG